MHVPVNANMCAPTHVCVRVDAQSFSFACLLGGARRRRRLRRRRGGRRGGQGIAGSFLAATCCFPAGRPRCSCGDVQTSPDADLGLSASPWRYKEFTKSSIASSDLWWPARRSMEHAAGDEGMDEGEKGRIRRWRMRNGGGEGGAAATEREDRIEVAPGSLLDAPGRSEVFLGPCWALAKPEKVG